MKKFFYFLLLVSLASCGDEVTLGPSGNIRLNIDAKFAGQPLVMNQPYLFGGANQVQFDQFNFFISNVTLLEAATEDETDLLEVALADFSANTDPGNVQPASFYFHTVPSVKYRGIKISIGVPSGLNKASVVNYGAGHPLKQAFDTHFWADGNSFFFMKLAGIYDLNGDGIFGGSPADNPFELFPAKNSNLQTVTLLKTFTLDDGQTLDLNMSVDVLKLLQGAGNQTIDFADPSNLSTYNPSNDDLSALLMGNFKTALELK
ncbi:MAG: hypothetical protein K9J37_15295 [Saprospiraceae bacterium]|nr:hypothetical protein [Saprospiraceae bacterium]MCF8251276.1 hypothetical protein [Saprospiraceae bacterium]MCF8280833.1 hypothetical protein [Bacteroidales bacterium]MCF8311813.1 hypothetical protein [Saprospiraceae bacterium]MCF8441954.1 hypothetical protein [Saprospiraceae bacterium]